MRVSNLTDSRILIVDDQTANLQVLATVLEFAGYANVSCLRDSRQILPIFGEFQPDLVLLDLHMPHVDGLAAMDQLATVIPKDDYLPILVLTGDNTSEAKEKALSHGAHDFLSKPLNRTEVQLRVKNLLETRHLHLQLKAQNASLEQQVRERTELADELGRTNQKLRETQAHLIHSEKMAGLGQLVAGIAHEINNPLAFVINNIFIVEETLGKLAAEEAELPPKATERVRKMKSRISDAHPGATRVKELVSKLRTFSRLDEGTVKTINIHESIESVLLFLRHKMEGRIEVDRHYGRSGNGHLPGRRAEPGAHEHRRQRHRRDRWAGADHARHRRAEWPFRDSCPRYRKGNTGGHSQPNIRAVFHHQAGRPRHWAGARHILRHHEGPPGFDGILHQGRGRH